MGSPMYHRLVTNGFSMSSTGVTARRYMRYFVYWPAIIRNEPPRKVLVVGYGVGLTTGATTHLDSVHSIDVLYLTRHRGNERADLRGRGQSPAGSACACPSRGWPPTDQDAARLWSWLRSNFDLLRES